MSRHLDQQKYCLVRCKTQILLSQLTNTMKFLGILETTFSSEATSNHFEI